jgi:hypothetical protein
MHVLMKGIACMKKTETQYISTRYASTLSGVTLATIRNWIQIYGIGKKIGGRWKVDYAKLQILLKGYTGQMVKQDEKETRKKISNNSNNSRTSRGSGAGGR